MTTSDSTQVSVGDGHRPDDLVFYEIALKALPLNLKSVSEFGQVTQRATSRQLIEEALESLSNQEKLGAAMRRADMIGQLVRAGRYSALASVVNRIGQWKSLVEALRTPLGNLDWQLESSALLASAGESEAINNLQRQVRTVLQVAPQPSGLGRRRIFLSYARADDESFTRVLYELLTERGFEVWWDRACMPNRGLMFMREIYDAIYSSDVLLLVWGPGANASEYVRAEWDHARVEMCKPVLTILRTGDYNSIPSDLKSFDIPDFRDDGLFEDRLDYLVRQIEQESASVGELLGVPPLPDHYVERHESISAMKSYLMANADRAIAASTASRKAGYVGMAGSGKSVLAAAVARDCDIRRVFDGGIFWIDLGRYADDGSVEDGHVGAEVVSRLCQLLCGGYLDFRTVDEGWMRVRKLLTGKRVLVILDNLSAYNEVGKLSDLGSGSAILVTARNEALLPPGSFKHEPHVLTPAQARSLVSKWMTPPEELLDYGRSDREYSTWQQLPDAAGLVLSEVGNLPLAIALCAANVRDGIRWEALLDALRSARLKFIDHAHGSVLSSMQVSVDQLKDDDASSYSRYLELAVFANIRTVPEQVVLRLWRHTGNLSGSDAETLLVVLKNRSLVRLNGEFPHRNLILHDLQQDYLVNECTDLSSIHAALVDAYRTSQDSDEWHKCEDDDYIFENLVHHLFEAGMDEAAFHLLTDSGKWQAAKARIKGYAAVVDETELALRRVKSLSDGDRYPRMIQLFAVWHISTVGARNYFDIDLETLVHLGRTVEALGCARIRSTVTARLASLVAIRDALVLNESHNKALLSDVTREMLQIFREAPSEEGVVQATMQTLAQSGEFRYAEELIGELSEELALDATIQLGRACLAHGRVVNARTLASKIQQRKAAKSLSVRHRIAVAALLGDTVNFVRAADTVDDALERLEHLAFGLECFPSSAELLLVSERWMLSAVPFLKYSATALTQLSREIFHALSIADQRGTIERVIAAIGNESSLREEAILLSASQGIDVETDALSSEPTTLHRLTEAWLSSNNWQKALTVAHAIPHESWRHVDALGQIGVWLGANNMARLSLQIFRELRSLVDRLPHVDWNKSAASSRLALYLARTGLHKEAEEEFARAETLINTAVGRVDMPGNLTAYDAESLFGGCGEERERAQWVLDIASSRLSATLDVAKALVDFGDTNRARVVFERLGVLADRIRSARKRAWYWMETAKGFSSLRCAVDCNRYVEKLLALLHDYPLAGSIWEKRDDYLKVLCHSMVELDRLGRRDEALSVFELAQDEVQNPRTPEDQTFRLHLLVAAMASKDTSESPRFRLLIGSLADIGQCEAALLILDQSLLPILRASEGDQFMVVADQVGMALVEILVALFQTNPVKLNEALSKYPGVMPVHHKVAFFGEVAIHIARGNRVVADEVIQGALGSMDEIRLARDRSHCCLVIARYYRSIGESDREFELLQEATRLLEAIPDLDERASLLKVIERASEEHATFEDIDAANAASERLRNLTDYPHKDRYLGLSRVAIELAKAKRFDEARAVIPKIHYEWRSQAEWELMNELAADRQFDEAFRLLRSYASVEGFVGTVRRWIAKLEPIEPQMQATVFGDVLRIAGWVRPDLQALTT